MHLRHECRTLAENVFPYAFPFPDRASRRLCKQYGDGALRVIPVLQSHSFHLFSQISHCFTAVSTASECTSKAPRGLKLKSRQGGCFLLCPVFARFCLNACFCMSCLYVFSLHASHAQTLFSFEAVSSHFVLLSCGVLQCCLKLQTVM